MLGMPGLAGAGAKAASPVMTFSSANEIVETWALNAESLFVQPSSKGFRQTQQCHRTRQTVRDKRNNGFLKVRS